MAKLQVLTQIGVLVGSFLGGVLFFYVTSPHDQEVKKQQLDTVLSQLINLIIFIWVGKIIFHIKLFVQDPFAVLAYPSNSEAFYIASGLFLLTVSFQVYRQKVHLQNLVTAFVPVLLAASFVYEFIQLVVYEIDTLIYLALLMVLLIVYLLINRNYLSQLTLVILWAAGLLAVSFFKPYVTIFSFIVSRYFLIAVIILFVLLIVYNKRKKVI